MYVGRFVVVGPGIGGYRVSSRSFPHRKTVDRGDRVAVEPTEAAPPTDNPYVSYNCARAVVGQDDPAGAPDRHGPLAVLGNGSHVDPIA
jgi:IMP cyclohydrolase